jgi:fumarate reductase iron-sulfur subunit
MANTVVLEVFRYDPETRESRMQDFDVEYQDDWVVLDALNHIKDQIDGTLSHRWSCRMGVCGSCGMVVNGYPKLTCSAFIRDYLPGPIRVEPLANFEVERDLIVDFDMFLEKLQRVTPWLVRDEERPIEDGEHIQTPAQLAQYKQYTLCINCMLCYSACPVVSHEPDFLGPAALALGHRYNLDSRDQGKGLRLDEMLSSDGIWDCTFVGACSDVCPKHVDPAGAIQQAKVSGTMEYFKSFLMPTGSRK